MKTKIYIPDFFEAYPLYFALKKNILPHNFSLHSYSGYFFENDHSEEQYIALVDVYSMAKMPGKLWIISDAIFAMKDQSLHFYLFFKEGQNQFKKVGLSSSNYVLNLLAKIIVQEKYEMEPKFVTCEENPESFSDCDAFVLDGHQAFELKQKDIKYIDLVEEWFDFIEKPFPYLFWVSSEKEMGNEIDLIKKSRDLGIKYLPDIAENRKLHPDVDWLETYRFFTDHSIFHLNEEIQKSMKEFWQYGFYYGEFQYIPEIKFAQVDSK